jgi:hypothetical protein
VPIKNRLRLLQPVDWGVGAKRIGFSPGRKGNKGTRTTPSTTTTMKGEGEIKKRRHDKTKPLL